MKKLINLWLIPLVIALVLVVLGRFFLFKIVSVPDNSMQFSLNKNQIAVFSKIGNWRQNSVVLANIEKADGIYIKRIIGLPGDTLHVRHSILHINGDRVRDAEGVSYNYIFKTDDLSAAHSVLKKAKINYKPELAQFGVFKIKASLKELRTFKNKAFIEHIKRLTERPSESLFGKATINSHFYWNKDNFGPIIIPAKGLEIQLNKMSFYVYEKIIEKETGGSIQIENGMVLYKGKRLGHYTFTQDYYFLLNDNREDCNDSRSFGLVAEKQLKAKYLFSLPW